MRGASHQGKLLLSLWLQPFSPQGKRGEGEKMLQSPSPLMGEGLGLGYFFLSLPAISDLLYLI